MTSGHRRFLFFPATNLPLAFVDAGFIGVSVAAAGKRTLFILAQLAAPLRDGVVADLIFALHAESARDASLHHEQPGTERSADQAVTENDHTQLNATNLAQTEEMEFELA